MSRPFRPTDAFIDESIRGQRYLLACVLVEPQYMSAVRRTLLDARVADRRIHFTNETPKRRREILQLIAVQPIRATVASCVRSHGIREHDARAYCLEQLVVLLQAETGVSRLVIESRQDDRDDVRVIERARRRDQRLIFEHRIAREEPLLWLADAIAWAVGTGGEWRAVIDAVVDGVIETGP